MFVPPDFFHGALHGIHIPFSEMLLYKYSTVVNTLRAHVLVQFQAQLNQTHMLQLGDFDSKNPITVLLGYLLFSCANASLECAMFSNFNKPQSTV